MDNENDPLNKIPNEPRKTEIAKEPAADKTGLLALIILVVAIVVLYFVFRPHPPATVPAVTTPTPAVQITPQTNETPAVP